MFFQKEWIFAAIALFCCFCTQIRAARLKRMYALCPPHFIRIGNECYFISEDRVNWLDAHFECKDRNSRLAEPVKQEDRFLRKYLNSQTGRQRYTDIWIGGRFNWEKNKWQWGYNGKEMTYQSFSQMSSDRKDLKFHCAILKPELKYRWSASSCVEEHQYICQHRMPYVSQKNREKVWSKWNNTFGANEMANEIEVLLSEDDILRNKNRNRQLRNRRIRNRPGANRQVKGNNLNDFLQSKRRPLPPQGNPSRETRMGNKNRQENEVLSKKFDIQLNRSRMNGGGKRIQFNTTDPDEIRRQRKLLRMERLRKQKLRNASSTTTARPTWPTMASTTTSTTTTTTTSAPTTTWPQWIDPYQITETNIPLTDTQIIEQKLNNEQIRYETQQNRKLEEQIRLREMEEQRLLEEKRLRENHIHELERRRLQYEEEQRQQEENARIRNEKQRQDEMRKQINEENRIRYEEEQRKQMELLRQREEQAKASENQQHLLQTNEVTDPEARGNDEPKKKSVEEKKILRKKIRERLQKLSPEEQAKFFALRAQRSKKSAIPSKENTT